MVFIDETYTMALEDSRDVYETIELQPALCRFTPWHASKTAMGSSRRSSSSFQDFRSAINQVLNYQPSANSRRQKEIKHGWVGPALARLSNVTQSDKS